MGILPTNLSLSSWVSLPCDLNLEKLENLILDEIFAWDACGIVVWDDIKEVCIEEELGASRMEEAYI